MFRIENIDVEVAPAHQVVTITATDEPALITGEQLRQTAPQNHQVSLSL
jgi:hypothetical protein